MSYPYLNTLHIIFAIDSRLDPYFRIQEVGATLIWDDGGSGATYDFSCYAPSSNDLSNENHVVGHFGIRDNKDGRKPKAFVVSFTGDKSSAFRRPVSYSQIWNDRGSGAKKDGAFWKVNCPNGYGSLSDLCKYGWSYPSINDIWCIKEDYLERDYHGTWIWNDRRSGARRDVDINGGNSEMTKQLVAATTRRGTKKWLKKIKSEFIGTSKYDLNIYL